MSHSNPHRRQRTRETNVSGTVKTLATTAVVAYGAYKAYQFLTDQDSSHDQDHVYQDQPFLSMPRWLSSFWNNDHAGNDQSHEQYHNHQQQQPRRQAQQRQQSPAEIRNRHRLAQQSRHNCRHKVLEAYTKCWPAILQVIEDATNTATLTQELRALRQQQQQQDSTPDSNSTPSHHRQRQDELWKQIQLETITKFVTTIYASSLLFLSLTMQLHWINGQVFQQQQQQYSRNTKATTTITNTTREAQHLMMQAHHYMTTQGIPILIAAVRRAIAHSTLEQYQPTTMVTCQDIDHALDEIEKYLENGTSTSHSRNWIRIVLPDPVLHDSYDNRDNSNEDDDDGDDNDEAKTITAMLEAWWDLAESPAWQDAQQQTIHSIRQHLHDKGWGQAFPKGNNNNTNNDQRSQIATNDNVMNASDPCQVPLAKLMAPFKASIGLVQGEGSRPNGTIPGQSPNHTRPRKEIAFFRKVQSLATVLELGDVSFQE